VPFVTLTSLAVKPVIGSENTRFTDIGDVFVVAAAGDESATVGEVIS
jgi:hypothetical protein